MEDDIKKFTKIYRILLCLGLLVFAIGFIMVFSNIGNGEIALIITKSSIIFYSLAIIIFFKVNQLKDNQKDNNMKELEKDVEKLKKEIEELKKK